MKTIAYTERIIASYGGPANFSGRLNKAASQWTALGDLEFMNEWYVAVIARTPCLTDSIHQAIQAWRGRCVPHILTRELHSHVLSIDSIRSAAAL